MAECVYQSALLLTSGSVPTIDFIVLVAWDLHSTPLLKRQLHAQFVPIEWHVGVAKGKSGQISGSKIVCFCHIFLIYFSESEWAA